VGKYENLKQGCLLKQIGKFVKIPSKSKAKDIKLKILSETSFEISLSYIE